MNNGSQQKVLEMLQTRKVVRSREFIRECAGWDFRKAITRLRRQGHKIENCNPPGCEGCYVYTDREKIEIKFGG